MIKNIIFDFDGTIADSGEIILPIYNKLAKEKGFKVITKEDIDIIKKLPPLEILKILNISFWQIPYVAKRIIKDLKNSIDNVNIYKDIDRLLLNLHKKKYNLYLISSNSEKNIVYILDKFKINFFEQILTAKFYKDKALKKLIKKYKLNKSETIYIGDEYRDVIASHKIGIKVISVLWGYNSKDLLEKSHTDFLVNTPLEIEKIIENLGVFYV